MMAAIDQTIVAVALPAMIEDLDASLALASWTLIANQLTQTIVLPLAGKLGDRWGRKRLLLWSILLFAIGSVGAGLSPNIYVLIAFRVLQAIGGGMFFPSAAGIVGDIFVEGRQTAVGLFVTIFQVGGIIGPNVGGVVTDLISWRAVFFINVPFSIIILILGLAMIPQDRVDEAARTRHLDTSGAALLAAGIFAFLFGLTYLANNPDALASPVPWVSFASGVILLRVFLHQERRQSEPIVDLKLVRWRPFLACNAQLFMWSSCFNGFFNFIPLYASIAYGLNATQGGAILTPRAVMAVVVSLLASIFVSRLGYRRPWLVGIYLLAISMILMGTSVDAVGGLGISPFAAMAAITLIAGIATGLAMPPAQAAYFDLRPDLMSTAAGLRAMAGNSGAVFGTTVVTLFISQFDDKAAGIAIMFFILGLVVLLSQFWVFMVPGQIRRGGTAGAPA